MSPYPRDFKADLIECIRDNPKVMEHVHLPLQSGDADLLKTMKRQYSVDEFLQIVEELRSAVPHMGITTDIIVGFPGETEAQFENTLNVVKQVRFDGAYMFIYSPRPGTPAAEMEQLPYKIKQERLQRLMDLQNQITIERNLAWVGRTVEVLIEGASKKHPTMLQGYSREWKMVQVHADTSIMPGDLVRVGLKEAFLWGLRGAINDRIV
jgi:tRNA-2-methylthio-N6-dimethylallyladenosine synthase